MNTLTKMFCLTAATTILGCGGGGDSAPPTPTSAEGAYGGTISGTATASAFQGVVLEDGQYWLLYGSNAGGSFVLNGLLQGQGTSSNGVFASSNLRDFFAGGTFPGSLSFSYVAGTSITGAITEAGVSFPISGAAISPATYDYNAPALISSIAGVWNMTVAGGGNAVWTIASNGSLSSLLSGCSSSGTISPRPSGKNVYNVQITVGPAPCLAPGVTTVGIGLLTKPPNSSHQLLVALVDGSRTSAIIGNGTR